ncbi:MAG: PAS domain-containing protein [Rubrivivax sp.]|nr:PAS domain-containing protein [Rubrivivax sp.]
MQAPSEPDADALLHAAPVALLHVGADGLLRRCNAAAQALCGSAARAGEPWTGLFATTGPVALTNPPAAPQGLRLRDEPAQEVELSTQALPAGGWVLALQPRRTAPAPTPGDAESSLALAVDLGRIAVWRHDLTTDRVHCNARTCDVLELPLRPEGLALAEVRALIHPEDLPRVLDSAQQALLHSGPTDMQARYRRVDGSWRQVMTRRVVQRDAEGRPVAFLGVALDLTTGDEQQRQAEDMTRRFARATAAAGIGYWVLTRGDSRPTWSPALRALFDLPPAAPAPGLAEWLARHVHADDRDAVRGRIGAWVRSGHEHLALPLRILRPDGGVRYLLTHSHIEKGGLPPLMYGVVVDLTERRSAELALRNAQERVALAARGAGLGTWELDHASGEVFWDGQMWLLRGHAPQPRAMTDAERMACVHPDDRDIVHRQLGEALARGTLFENEFRVVWPDGQVRWLASRSAEFRDEYSGARRRIGVNWDVTDKRTAEAARRERELALRESQAKSRFLARMSHELRTPLNAVLGFSQLLLAEAGDSGDVDPRTTLRRRQLEHIRSAGEHLLALINDVLDLSSLESGELRIELQPVALAPLVAQTLPMLDALRDRHGVELQPGALPGVVMADATRLRQVLLNLLSNAIKYNHSGGRVHIEARPAGAEVLIRVTDTGHGMSAEQMRHLFEPFNRLGRHSEGPEGIEGSGIGLAIVKALMARMGGSVQVQSTPGSGSVFELRLANGMSAPAVAPPAVAVARRAPTDVPTPPRGTLLYVEDNPVNALIISELLARRADLQLHIAVDGRSGVQRALELRPDLVLLDMQLPDFDGHEVLRRLRAHPALAEVPVIALSANAMPDDIERALRAGMADYWTKPLDFTAFLAALERMFGPAPT